jgi:hypothetical protein
MKRTTAGEFRQRIKTPLVVLLSHNYPLIRKKAPASLQVLVGLIFCTGFVVSALNVNKFFLHSGTSKPNPASVSAQTNPPLAPLIVEQLVLTPIGFSPTEFKRPQGRFLLAVNNRAGIAQMNLVLNREITKGAMERLKEVGVHWSRPDWSEVFDLQPGTYLLTEASNPKWVCRITVGPKEADR